LLRIEETNNQRWVDETSAVLLVGDFEDYPFSLGEWPVEVILANQRLSLNPRWIPGSLRKQTVGGKTYLHCCTHLPGQPPSYAGVSAVLRKLRESFTQLKLASVATPPIGMGLGENEINWSVMEDMIKIWFGGSMSSPASSKSSIGGITFGRAPDEFLLELWKYKEA